MTEAPKPVSQSGGKCTVGCKLPHGVEISLYKDSGTLNNDGEKIIKRVAGPITLLGTNADKKGGKVVAGFGVTENVDADFMDAWLAQNPDFPAVKNGLIFIGKRYQDVRDQAKDHKDIQGIEPIDPDHPERHNGPDTVRDVKADNYEGMEAKD